MEVPAILAAGDPGRLLPPQRSEAGARLRVQRLDGEKAQQELERRSVFREAIWNRSDEPLIFAKITSGGHNHSDTVGTRWSDGGALCAEHGSELLEVRAW